MEKENFGRNVESPREVEQTGWRDISELAKKESWEEHCARAEKLVVNVGDAREEGNVNFEAVADGVLGKNEIAKMSDEELLGIGEQWDDVKVDETALREAIVFAEKPNAIGEKGLFVGANRNLPMTDDAVYRHVGTSAIRDLLDVGFVRNKRMATGAMGTKRRVGGTIGGKVYWYPGKEGVNEKADLVIEADKAQAMQGYVTKDAVRGIWVTNADSGEPVNLLAKDVSARKDRLKIGPHLEQV